MSLSNGRANAWTFGTLSRSVTYSQTPVFRQSDSRFLRERANRPAVSATLTRSGFVNFDLELLILLRLLAAATLGGIVGYERQSSGKQAGLRTHMLVAIGSALFTSCSDLAVDWASGATPPDAPHIMQVQVAVLTPVQAIATGIGFLGAGT